MPANNLKRRSGKYRSSEKRRREIIEGAVRFLAEGGSDALTIASLAKALGVNRAVIYYHFENRETLLDAILDWSSDQLSATFAPLTPDAVESPAMAGLVLDNPGLLKLWAERLITSSDITSSYPDWEDLVAGTRHQMGIAFPGAEVDAEVFAMMLLMGTIIGPRAFHASVDPTGSFADITDRFRQELNRMIGRPVQRGRPGPDQ